VQITAKNNTTGSMHVYYNIDDAGFSTNNISYVYIEESDDFQVLYLSIPEYPGQRVLTDIRIDPPDNSIFEIESIVISPGGYWSRAKIINDISQNFNLAKLPYIWANYDTGLKSEKPETLVTIGREITVDGSAELHFNGDVDKSSGNYLYLIVNSDSGSDQNMNISYNENNRSTIDLTILPGKNEYLIRISAQYAWMSENISSISFEASAPMVIESASILKGD